MGGITLGDFWFVIITVLWVGFFVLEGTNFAVLGTHSSYWLKPANGALLVATVEWSDLAGAGGSGNDSALYRPREGRVLGYFLAARDVRS